jgi:hypothetical protein
MIGIRYGWPVPIDYDVAEMPSFAENLLLFDHPPEFGRKAEGGRKYPL